jgi:hypothetical protein
MAALPGGILDRQPSFAAATSRQLLSKKQACSLPIDGLKSDMARMEK